MHTLYIDFETFYDPSAGITLDKMTLRSYFAAIASRPNKGLLGMGFAIDEGPSEYWHGLPDQDFLDFCTMVATSDDWVVVAHNAAFDVRVWRFVLGLPQPRTVDCSLELAQGAWPNQPGGYSLKSLAVWFGLAEKIAIDLTAYTPAEIEAYCKRDVELCREIRQRALSRLCDDEIRIQRACQAVRELSLEINGAAVTSAIEGFKAASKDEAAAAADALGIPMSDQQAFGMENDGTIRSVKPHQLKNYLLEICGYDAQSISVKKNNPARLAANPQASSVIHAAGRANKALSHRRRMAVFAGVPIVDVELCYHPAHTGRYSSKMSANTTGKSAKGINLHNQPKRNKRIAKLIRSVFRTPGGFCWVSGDLSNVEYRIEGWLTGCAYIDQLFARDIFADPYSQFGSTATGLEISKEKTPALRQVFKGCVLGLGFLMGIQRWINELLLMLADYEANKVTLKDMQDLCAMNGWGPVSDGRVRAAQTKLGAPWEVAAVAYHTRRLFHEIHPEFARTAYWILDTLKVVASALDPAAAIEMAYKLPAAPDQAKVGLVYDPTIGPGRCVRVACGNWAPTVTWRDLGVHDTKFGPAFASLQGHDKGYRAITPSIVIENVTQAAARNALVKGKLRLLDMGHRHILSVHDEAKLYAPCTPLGVQRAAADLLSVYGPGNDLGYGPMVLINPAEVTVCNTLFDPGEMPPGFWDALARGDDSLLTNLP